VQVKQKTPILSAKVLYWRMLNYVKPHWFTFSMSILALIILAATNTGFLATIKTVTDEGFVNSKQSNNALLPILLIGLLSLRALSGFISAYTMRWVGRKVIEQIRLDAFKANDIARELL